jgi:hypothetical protein
MKTGIVLFYTVTGYRLPVAGKYRFQVAGCKLQVTGYQLPGNTGSRLQVAGYWVTSYQEKQSPVTSYQLKPRPCNKNPRKPETGNW